MKGLIGQKMGMTQVWDNAGKIYPVTVLEVGPCVITQIKTLETDGYNSVQLSFKDKKPSRVNKPAMGHFNKAGAPAKYITKEFREMSPLDKKMGENFDASLFKPGEMVNVTGTSKGKGNAGVMKAHNFKGGSSSHGKSDQLRKGGSIGASSDPSRVFPGTKMAKRLGGTKSTVRNLTIVSVDAEKNIIMVKGAVAGPRNGFIYVTKS
jgi:large subunit ribosomal protein L3